LNDLVIVRSDGRPTYNFVSPVDDVFDEITHVIRGEDHVSNTPTQINILRALGADLPVYAHVPNINGEDGRKLSKRHGAVGIDEFREDGYLPAALFNFLALLGWSYDDKTTIVQEKIEKFSQYPAFARFFFEDVTPPEGVDAELCEAAAQRVEAVDPWEATAIEEALRALADERGLKPRDAFQPLRLAITGSKISPGLFESIELLGREKSLERLRAAVAA